LWFPEFVFSLPRPPSNLAKPQLSASLYKSRQLPTPSFD